LLLDGSLLGGKEQGLVFAIQLGHLSWLEEPDADEEAEEKAGDQDDKDEAAKKSLHGHGGKHLGRGRTCAVVKEGLAVPSEAKPSPGPRPACLLASLPLAVSVGQISTQLART